MFKKMFIKPTIMKREKASITLLLIVTVIVFLIAIFSIIFQSNNSKIHQNKQIKKIQEEYNPTFETIEQEYEKNK